MTAPKAFQSAKPLDPRLVTKTALNEPKKAIALMLILWFAEGKPEMIIYGDEKGSTKNGGIVDTKLVETIKGYAREHSFPLNDEEIWECLRKNPLVISQMESLNSAFELVWHLGSFAFTDNRLSRSSERTGGIRFQKKISYSSNLDLIGILEETNSSAFAGVLLNWFTGKMVSGNDTVYETVENRLIRMLAVFSESTLYKSSKGVSGTIFAISGVYDALLERHGTVDIVDPNEEVQGTTRILKSAIQSGLVPFLSIKNNSVAIDNNVDEILLQQYAARIHVNSAISKVKFEAERNVMDDRATADSIDAPRNWIFFGAPGTGKSHELNRIAEESFSEENISRVTFYPDYTYSQFVGCFKPITEKTVDENGETVSHITYRYVLGPFLKTYVEARKHPDQNYLLIVEEINRANPAAVFGDIFQLLDRRDDGCSEYSIATPEEMSNQLKEVFKDESTEADKLAIPSNMYIWATMNSADQGVFPMDTAFKRRWDFRYMGIDEGEKKIVKVKNGDVEEKKHLDEINIPCGKHVINWNGFRKAINNFMMSDNLKVNEDKLLGPFFVSPSALNEKRFADVFKDKVILYLYEDACKTKHQKMFRSELKTYAQICDAFNKVDAGIFADGFDASDIYVTDEDDDQIIDDDDNQSEAVE